MTAADLAPDRLDPQHILAVCTRATGRDTGVQATRTADGIRVSFPARRAAWTAAAALGRTGYTAAHVSTDRASRDLLVTGWNADRLDSRLTASSWHHHSAHHRYSPPSVRRNTGMKWSVTQSVSSRYMGSGTSARAGGESLVVIG